MNERGNMSLYMMYLLAAIMGLLIFVLVIPLTQTINTEFYAAAEDMLIDANTTANDFNNVGIKTALQGSFQAQIDSIETSNDILSVFFQYAWAIVIFIVMLPMFLFGRQLVESRRGGGSGYV